MRRIILVILIAPLAADTCYGPRTSTWLSDDHHWQLVVVPNVLSRATLYRKGWFGIWHRVSRAVDEGRVADALVTNDGTFVTLNLTTSGNDVIAIYRRDGTLVRKVALSDLMSDQDVARLPHSNTSIQWGRMFPAEEGTVVLQVFAAKPEEISISLTTGEVLVPRHPFFPWPRVTWNARDVVRCIDDLAPMAGTEIESHALAACLPDYPPLARKVNIGGLVIAEIDIDTEGNVAEINMIKPLPFGLDGAAREAVSNWRFKPLERHGKPVPACGQVVFSFTLSQ